MSINILNSDEQNNLSKRYKSFLNALPIKYIALNYPSMQVIDTNITNTINQESSTIFESLLEISNLPNNLEVYKSAVAELLNSFNTYSFEQSVSGADGVNHFYEIQVSIINRIDDSQVNVCIYFIEITDKINAESEAKSNIIEYSTLNEEFAAQNQEINAINDELIEKNIQLAENEKSLRLLFNEMIAAYAIFEPLFNDNEELTDCIIVNVNKAFEQITKLNSDEIKGKRITQLAKWIGNDLFKVFENVYKTGVAIEISEYKSPRGLFFQIHVFKPGDKHFALMFNDVSEKKRAERQLKEQTSFLNTIFHGIQEGISIVDEYENITFCNPAFAKMIEEPIENLIGANLKDIFDPTLFPFFQEETKKRKTGESSIYEILYTTKSCKNKYFRIYVSPQVSEDNKIVGSIASILDISERVETDTQLVKAKEKAEESDKLKSTFLANMSHEIRTPMNGIIGFAELLSKPSITEEKRKLYTNLIQTRSRDLLELINDIIDFSKIEAGQMNITLVDFNLESTIEEMYTFFSSKIKKMQKKNVEIRKSLPPNSSDIYSVSDVVKIKQVLINLVENALKFTEEGYIEIGFKIEEEEIYFFVKDTGIGVPQDKQSLIFERFRQVDETTNRTYGGAGLGLAICKAYITMLNGQIGVNSESGKGSEFYFSIPYKPSKAKKQNITQEGNIDFDFTGKTILLVEDDPASALFMQEFLSDTGANIFWAEDGTKALTIFKRETAIDAVLLDIQLPEISGYQVAREMKIHNEKIPIIAQTAYASLEDKKKCLLAGCSDYVRKPVEPDELLNKLNTAFTKNKVGL